MKYNNQIFLDEFKNKMLEINPQKVLFVCSKDYDRYGYRKALDEINIESVSFTSFEPCPEASNHAVHYYHLYAYEQFYF
jgi:hypothetical protein